MMRLIDADELKTAFPCGESVRTECVRATIDHMPTIKPEPERKIELHGDESAIEILSELRSWFSCFDEKEGLAYHALSLAIRAIKTNSAAELEIIRCKDCKHRGEKPIADGRYWCDIHDAFMYYCSDAERRIDE